MVVSLVDENESWKASMQIRRIGLCIDLKINTMVDAEIDRRVDCQVDSIVHQVIY